MTTAYKYQQLKDVLKSECYMDYHDRPILVTDYNSIAADRRALTELKKIKDHISGSKSDGRFSDVIGFLNDAYAKINHDHLRVGEFNMDKVINTLIQEVEILQKDYDYIIDTIISDFNKYISAEENSWNKINELYANPENIKES